MPYPTGHREKIRRQIVDSGRRLFNRNGFENVSIDAIMAHAGLTRGAFYNYFESKSDLYTEVLGCFFTDPNWKNRWKGVKVDLASPDAGPQIIRAYLSRQHLEDVENSCPMVALPCDVARRRRAAEDRLRERFQSHGPDLQSRGQEKLTAVRHRRLGNREPLHRRHGRRALSKRSPLRRPPPPSRHPRRARVRRLEVPQDHETHLSLWLTSICLYNMSRHMRTTVRLDDALLDQARREAARHNQTLTALIEQGLRLVLAQSRPSREKRRRVVLPVSGQGGLQPGVDLSDSAALLDVMENTR
jgi:AcrR family transcriptional regulator